MSTSTLMTSSTVSKSNPGFPRILYISGFFVPRGDAEAFCAANFAVALANCGLSLSVITCPDYLRRYLDASKLWDSIQSNTFNVPLPGNSNRLRSLRMAVRYRSWVYARWIGAAIREAKRLHRQLPFDVVYSRSLPMFSHIAGYWSSRALNIPWMATINDPWDWHHFPIGSLGPPVFPEANVSDYWMRKTHRAADVVIYPSDRLHTYHRKLSGVSHEALILPHVGSGFLARAGTGQTQKFNMVHTSALKCDGSTGRSTKTLLDGLQMFLKESPEARISTRLTLVGPQDSASQSWTADLGLQENVRWTGRVSYEDSIKHVQDATVGVLVEAEMKEGIFLPSKLVDYLSAKKPVLALSPSIGVVNDMAQEGGILRVDSGDVDGVRRAIGMLYHDFHQGTLADRAPRPEQIGQFDPSLLASKFLAAFHTIDRSMKSKRQNSSNRSIAAEAMADL